MKRSIIALIVLFPILLLLPSCDTEPDFPSAPVSGTLLVYNQTSAPLEIIQYRVSAGATTLPGQWSYNMIGWVTVQQSALSLPVPPGTYDIYVETRDEYAVYFTTTITTGETSIITVR
jgi:hypothetical protein